MPPRTESDDDQEWPPGTVPLEGEWFSTITSWGVCLIRVRSV